MPRSVAVAIEDILTAISHIDDAVEGIDYAAYENDWRLQYIVERGLEIISEASRALPDHFKQGHPDIKWIGVRDIGNVLRHQYATLSKILLWNVVQDELPKLGTALETLRSRPHESGGE